MPKIQELRGMSDEQLGLTLKDLEKHLFQLRFQAATDRLKASAEIRKTRRDIARVKTVQRARELAKLRELSPDQLASRIAALDTKVQQGVPGKRVAYRQARRLRRFYEEKTGRPAPDPATAPAAGGTAPTTRTPASPTPATPKGSSK